MYDCKQTFRKHYVYITGEFLGLITGIKNAKFSGLYFYINTNIKEDF